MQNSLKLLILILVISSVMIKCRSHAKTKTASAFAAAVNSSEGGAAAAGNLLQQTQKLSEEDSASQKDKVSADWLLIPGISAGKTVINSSAASVYQRLGTPDSGDAAMMKSVAIWYNNHDRAAHSTSIYSTIDAGNDTVARVKLIRVTSPTFKTKDGIGPSSFVSEIKRTFNKLKKTETYKNAKKTYNVYDSIEGIAFEIDMNEKCVAVVIHEQGKYSSGTYLKFR